jgi:hypothetical protein
LLIDYSIQIGLAGSIAKIRTCGIDPGAAVYPA